MKRSNNKQKEMTAALYVRLSRDDNLEGDSYSIGNQKKLLTKIAKEKGEDCATTAERNSQLHQPRRRPHHHNSKRRTTSAACGKPKQAQALPQAMP